MANRDGFAAHEDLLHQYPQDLLTLGHIQRVRSRPQPCTEIGKCFNQPQVLRLIGGSRLQRLQFGLNRVVLLAELRHAAAQLFQAHQAFLIGDQQPVHALGQPCVISVQLVFALFQGVGILGRFQPAVQFLLDDGGIFQQPQELVPDHRIQIVLAHWRIFANRSFEMRKSVV